MFERIKICLFCLTLVVSCQVYATIDIRNHVWLLHPLVTGNVYIAEKILEIENAAKNSDWQGASFLARNILGDTCVKNAFLSDGEPLPMVLECMGAVYSLKWEGQDKAVNNLVLVLNKYKKQAAGKRCYSYKYAQHYLRSVYQKNNNLGKVLDIYKECIEYDPYDKVQIISLINWGNQKENIHKINEIIDFLIDLQSKEENLDLEIALKLISYPFLDLNERFELLSKWLGSSFSYNPQTICLGLNELCCVTNSEDLSLVIKARNLTTDMALRQKNEEARLSVIATALRVNNILEEYLYKKNYDFSSTVEKYQHNSVWPQSEWNSFIENNTIKSFNLRSLNEMIKYLWSSENRQRAADKLSLSLAIKSIDKIEELTKRLNDSSDLLYDIDQYRDMLLISGVPGKLYWVIESLFWKGEYEKAYRAFQFILSYENEDEFTKGAAHFYIGRMLHCLSNESFDYSIETREDDALKHLLLVPTYSTCLTYVSFAYIMAAEILNTKKYYNAALALCQIDVPSVDFAQMKTRKHNAAAQYALAANAYTNYVKNVLECLRYADQNKIEKIKRFTMKKEISQEMWKYCQNNPLNDYDKNETLEKSLLELNDSEFIESFYTVATLNWPHNYELPQNIATNRTLNNNVFKKEALNVR